jgi:hypothetical protein
MICELRGSTSERWADSRLSSAFTTSVVEVSLSSRLIERQRDPSTNGENQMLLCPEMLTRSVETITLGSISKHLLFQALSSFPQPKATNSSWVRFLAYLRG